MKEIKDDINRWRDAPCFWVGIINPVEMTILPNTIDRFNTILIILPVAFFTQKTLNSQSNLKNNESGRISLPNFRLYYKATVIKTVWYWNRWMEQDRKPRDKHTHLWAPYL